MNLTRKMSRFAGATIVLSGLCALFFMGLSAQAAPVPWKMLRIEGGHHVSMPGTPSMARSVYHWRDGDGKEVIYALRRVRQGDLFYVDSVEVPLKTRRMLKPNQILQAQSGGFFGGRRDDKIVSRRALSMRGYRGLELIGLTVMGGKSVILRSHAFLVRGTLITLVSVAPNKAPLQREGMRFLNSFRLASGKR